MASAVRIERRGNLRRADPDPSLVDALSGVVGAAQRVALDRIEEGFLRVRAALDAIVDAGILLLLALVFAATAWLALNGGAALALAGFVPAPAALAIVAAANLVPAMLACAVATRRRARSLADERET